MKYVLYHSSITDDKSALNQLREHARDGEIIAAYFDDLSQNKEQPQLTKAVKKCRETDAMLLILDLTAINNFESSQLDGIQVKRLL